MKQQIKVELQNGKVGIKEYLEQQGAFSARKIKTLLKNKRIWINDKTAYFDNTVKSGDVIVMDLEEMGRDSTIPEEIPLCIVYEDEYLLAVNKSAGMLVHPTQNHPTGTLSNGVKYYFAAKGRELPIRLVNRIDMDTSGIVLIAKSGEAHSALSAQFEEGCEKIYYAVVAGKMEQLQGMIDQPLGIDETNPIKRAIVAGGQDSLTEYQVLEQYADAALIRVRLHTGRTHQIRVHMSCIGHPLLGDQLYGGSQQLIDRQALHAYELRFIHPFFKDTLAIKADLPEDLLTLIDKLRLQS